MEKCRIVRKIRMNCPICGNTHEVIEKTRLATTIVKNEEVSYEERFYYCANAADDENEFQTGEMVNENLLNARNAYRVNRGLLISDDIVSIREGYGLSQVDLARLLGWGEATVSRYESKAIQEDAYDEMLRIVRDNPLKALEFLKKNEKEFSKKKFAEVKSRIIEKLDTYGKEFLTRQALEGEYASFGEPSDLNGYSVINIDKIEAVVSYIAEKVNNLFKVKLMKMIWYADVLSYIEKGSSITGMVYIHEDMGALPIGHYSLMNLENICVKEEINKNYDTMFHIYPNGNIEFSVLDDKEKGILDRVIDKFIDYKTKDIVEYMHKEKAYIETKPGEIIPFTLARDLRDF